MVLVVAQAAILISKRQRHILFRNTYGDIYNLHVSE